tara:strand:+ start:220 stop:888 length:669 start_codon:yes stop_codon:yes gene_type:complete
MVRKIYRTVTLGLAAYFWWIGVGVDYVSSSEAEWGGGLIYLTNWVLTLNLLVHTRAFLSEIFRQVFTINFLVGATMVMNIVVLVLWWGLQLVDPTLLAADTEGWSTFYWIWEIYIHGGMAVLLFIEGVVFNKSFSSKIRPYAVIVGLFLAYIVWIELAVSRYNILPCGSVNCGFPYPFLNDLDITQRIIFYLGIWILGTVSFLLCAVGVSFKEKLFGIPRSG